MSALLMWVHGPNQQFDIGMFVMENNAIPTRQYWVDSLLADAEKYPFMILGSKYDGNSCDEFRSKLPLSLQHHLNGNAVYNTTRPILKKILNQLNQRKILHIMLFHMIIEYRRYLWRGCLVFHPIFSPILSMTGLMSQVWNWNETPISFVHGGTALVERVGKQETQ